MMNITIDNFENYVPFNILQRGQSYYEEGAIILLDEKEDGEWVAEVKGSRKYEVEVSVDEDGSISWDCDCPYDYGAICKHVVAVLIAIREEMSKQKKSAFNKPSPVKKTIRNAEYEEVKVSDEEFRKLMSLVKDAELKRFVKEYAGKNPAFQQELCAFIEQLYH